jgi:predicted DNA-binding WGR domain protein
MDGRDSRGEKLGRFFLLGYNSGMNTTLIRVDPDKHMDRRYSVAVQPTLLDSVAVICVWGSRRSSYQRMRVQPTSTQEEAQQVAAKIIRAKMRRGYQCEPSAAGGGTQSTP